MSHNSISNHLSVHGSRLSASILVDWLIHLIPCAAGSGGRFPTWGMLACWISVCGVFEGQRSCALGGALDAGYCTFILQIWDGVPVLKDQPLDDGLSPGEFC